MKVEKKYRTNPLSLTKGGVTVRVTLQGGAVRDYDDVKWPAAFCRKVMEGEGVVSCVIITEDNNE
jgi:hypothetical protein